MTPASGTAPTHRTKTGPIASRRLALSDAIRREVVALVGAAALLSGCAGSGQNSATNSTGDGGGGVPADQVAARYGYSLTRTDTLPVNAIIPQFRDPKDGYARDLLASRCLADTVPYLVSTPRDVVNGFDMRTGQMEFNAEIAADRGYSALRARTAPDTAVPDSITITDPILAEMVECGSKADERLGRPPERLVNSIDSAGWNAVESSALVAEAAVQWKQCMQPVGVIDLPDTPLTMPSPSIEALSGVAPGTDGGGTPAPSPREREIAMADAACRESSGYDTAVFDAKRDGQLQAIGANLEEFEAARIEYIEYEKGIDEVIAELG